MYSLPIPRITEGNKYFPKLLERCARLICTTLEVDRLARESGLKGYEDGVADPNERANLRAEFGALVAPLYGLTETEFAYILTTFPLVPESTKTAALAAYTRFAPNAETSDLSRLIAAGESAGLVSVSFGAVSGKTVCRIDVAAATEPVWVLVGGSERFYVRTGNSTRELSPSETHEYVRRRWG